MLENTEIREWADNLLKEVLEKWQSMKGRYDFHEYGFAVFYSPPYYNPELMLIGYNPGGRRDVFNPERDSTITSITGHEYFQNDYDYALARKMRELFEGVRKTPLLRSSVKLNLNFFRSPTMADWKQIDLRVRRELESFCYRKVQEIVERLHPRCIIAEGMQTYQEVKSLLHAAPEKKEYQQGIRGRAIYARSTFNHHRLIGLIHPSGAHISNDEWQRLATYLQSDLA